MGVHEFVLERGVYSSPLLHKGSSKSCCTSVNNVLVHGIPDELSSFSLLGGSRPEAECNHVAGHCRVATS